MKKVTFIFGRWTLTGRTVTQRPCCKQSKKPSSTLTFTFRNISLLTHFLRQRFFYLHFFFYFRDYKMRGMYCFKTLWSQKCPKCSWSPKGIKCTVLTKVFSDFEIPSMFSRSLTIQDCYEPTRKYGNYHFSKVHLKMQCLFFYFHFFFSVPETIKCVVYTV